VLTEILREGAQRMLAQAIDAEVAEWIDRHADLVDQEGRRQVVRNGHHPARTILTGVGPIAVEQPRVHDRRIVGRRACTTGGSSAAARSRRPRAIRRRAGHCPASAPFSHPPSAIARDRTPADRPARADFGSI
jgi:hypothetical protein